MVYVFFTFVLYFMTTFSWSQTFHPKDIYEEKAVNFTLPEPEASWLKTKTPLTLNFNAKVLRPVPATAFFKKTSVFRSVIVSADVAALGSILYIPSWRHKKITLAKNVQKYHDGYFFVVGNVPESSQQLYFLSKRLTKFPKMVDSYVIDNPPLAFTFNTLHSASH